MSGYKLSRRAEDDLLDMYIYGIERFGEAQGERYHIDMTACFALLATQPRMGREAATVAPGVRRHEHASHVIFYEEHGEGILILALVHARSIERLRL